jgi:hypothetical protein
VVKEGLTINIFTVSTSFPGLQCEDEARHEEAPLSYTYISGDRASIPRQSKMCDQKHGGFWPNLRHFDVTIDLNLW